MMILLVDFFDLVVHVINSVLKKMIHVNYWKFIIIAAINFNIIIIAYYIINININITMDHHYIQ